MTFRYRDCPRCAGESTFREGHLQCVRCGLAYAIDGTFAKDKWLLPTDEREAIRELWEQFNGSKQIEGVDIAEYLDHARYKQDVLALLNWLNKVCNS